MPASSKKIVSGHKPKERDKAKLRSSGRKRKNLILNQDKIDRAKAIFGVATETEAIDRALDAVNDMALFRAEVESGLADLVGKGGFVDHFPPSTTS